MQGMRLVRLLAATMMMGYGLCAGAVRVTDYFDPQHLAQLYRAKDIGKEPMVDAAGRTYYLVDLREGTDSAYSDADVTGATRSLPSRHSTRVHNMVADFEDTYGFEQQGVTSWVGLSVAAYLDKATAERLRHDNRVTMLTEVTTIELSSWQDTPALNSDFYIALAPEVQTWGRTAVNGKTSIANGIPYNPQVGYVAYVIDSGVAYHEDLNVGRRVNPTCTSIAGIDCASYPKGDPNYREPVGCWSHSTHVAGIVGARSGNGKGVAGVNAGMKIISVSVESGWAYFFDQNSYGIKCGMSTTPSVVDIVAALDWVRNDIYSQNRFRPGIVNLSMNGAEFTQPTLKGKLQALASGQIGGTVYAGAFVVQSAGNQFSDACQVSYNSPSPTDGIMVVGAMNEAGAPVETQVPPLNEPASNYGSCVEVWAPGIRILSAWSSERPLSDSNCLFGICQREGIVYNGYQKLTGTSMAAPHIAGIAGYLAETRNLTSGPAIEAAVRQYLYSTGWSDRNGRAVYSVRLP